MHIELQEKGVHVHISIDEKEFPKMGTHNLYEEAKGTLNRLQESRVAVVETIKTNGQYL